MTSSQARKERRAAERKAAKLARKPGQHRSDPTLSVSEPVHGFVSQNSPELASTTGFISRNSAPVASEIGFVSQNAPVPPRNGESVPQNAPVLRPEAGFVSQNTPVNHSQSRFVSQNRAAGAPPHPLAAGQAA